MTTETGDAQLKTGQSARVAAKSAAKVPERVAAYDTAVMAGAPRYGVRGRAGEKSALQCAAHALGLATAGPVLAALRTVDHAHIVASDAPRSAMRAAKVRAAERRAAVGAQGVGVVRAESRNSMGLAKDRRVVRAAQYRAKNKTDAAITRLRDRVRRLGVDAVPEAQALPVIEDLRRRPTGATLVEMFSRGQLSAQEARAAYEFRRCVEITQSSGVSSLDFTRELVDGGRWIFDAQPVGGLVEAGIIQRARVILGEIGFAFLHGVAVEGVALECIGQRLGLGGLAQRRGRGAVAYYAGRFREALAAFARAIPS